jgi:hypothetical protein
MGDISPADLAVADALFGRSDAAKKLINEAGKGLMEVFNAVSANAVKLGDVAKMQVVQGYLTEAAVLMLEAVALTKGETVAEIRGGTRLVAP